MQTKTQTAQSGTNGPTGQAAIRFRDTPLPADAGRVRSLVTSSGFFSEEETAIAAELVEERVTRGASSGYLFLFAESGGEMAGYTCYGPIPGTRFGYDLYWIAVHEAHRRRGIGQSLLSRTESDIRSRGGERIYVETSSREQYAPTRAFYRRCGYRQAAFLEDFYAPGDGKCIFLRILT